MTIRYGLVLAMALGLGLAGCASGGGGGGGGSLAEMIAAAGGEGEPPRETANTEQAEDLLEAAEAAADPNQARTHYEGALQAAEAEIQQDPENPLGHRLAALAALGLEDYETAGRHFDRAAELNMAFEFEDAQLREQAWIDLYNEAMPLVQQGQYEQAAEVFEDANAVYPNRPEAFIILGQIYGQLRQHDAALRNIDRAEEIIQGEGREDMTEETLAAWDQQAAELPLLRAQILSDAGRFEEAAAIFQQMVDENPEDVDAARNLAAVQMQMGNEEAAFQTYENLLSRPGLDYVDFYQIGVGFYQGEDYGRAADAFGRAVEDNPMDRDALEMQTRSLQLDSAYAEVPPVAEQWLELDPNSQNALLIMAQAINQSGDGQRAGELVRRVDELQVVVDELQIQRYNDGGARVTGTVLNKNMEPGTDVTLTFTFYGPDGNPLGTVAETVTLGQQDMSELIQVEFDSAEEVGGYGYELTAG